MGFSTCKLIINTFILITIFNTVKLEETFDMQSSSLSKSRELTTVKARGGYRLLCLELRELSDELNTFSSIVQILILKES